MKQTNIIILLTVLMSMVGVTAFAYDAKIGDIYYNFSDNEATVTYVYESSSYNSYVYSGPIFIPKTVTYNSKVYSVTSIGDLAFYECERITSVTIPNSVTTIGNRAFSGCSSLDYFSFGSAVSEIGQEAFSDCTAMTKLITKAMTPPNCLSQALDDINKWNCTLHVPKGTTPLYQQAAQWKEFFFIDDDAPTAINNVNGNENIKLKVKSTFSIDGKPISQPQKGVNIQKMSDGTSRKIVVD